MYLLFNQYKRNSIFVYILPFFRSVCSINTNYLHLSVFLLSAVEVSVFEPCRPIPCKSFIQIISSASIPELIQSPSIHLWMKRVTRSFWSGYFQWQRSASSKNPVHGHAAWQGFHRVKIPFTTNLLQIIMVIDADWVTRFCISMLYATLIWFGDNVI